MRDITAIPKEECLRLLHGFDIGSPIAETDGLLHEARVETAIFTQLLTDKIDIIRGTKGSGKSALYRLFATYFPEWLLDRRSIVIVRGIEVTGDPVFLKFRPRFDELDEIDFQNFWRIYFLSLINTQLIENGAFTERLAKASSEVRNYRRLARANGFPFAESLLTSDGIVQWVLAKIPASAKVKATLEPSGGISGGLEVARAEPVPERVPLFVTTLHEALVKLLDKAGLNIWIMLDRLDEVFPRRSKVETTALRALMKTIGSFTTEKVRLKLFLRDDIFDSITDAGGFAALTHVMSRCSNTLKWDRDQILKLLVNRIAANEFLATYLRISKQMIAESADYRAKVFYAVFPDRLRPGKNQSVTLDWLYKHCEDGNGVVTPRDFIDLVRMATARQTDICLGQAAATPTLLTAPAVLQGYSDMSIKKKETYLKAEFDHFWKSIEQFANGKAEHDSGSLARLLGGDWRRTVRDLKSIGFLKENARTGTVSVPFLYRQCLNIRQGRANIAH
jgi:hypothetical protein